MGSHAPRRLIHIESNNVISIDSFDAEFSALDGAGKRTWCACTVVGLTEDEHAPRFVVIIDDDGVCYAMTVDEVRRAPAASV